MKDNKQKQLFTELTPEEGAVVAGGANLLIHSIFAKKAGADSGIEGSGDDIYITVNGKELNFSKTLFTGDHVTVNLAEDFTGSAQVQLWDGDAWPNADDKIGSLWISETPVSKKWSPAISGFGSEYYVNYSVS